MIWAWIIYAIKNNKVAFILLFTIVFGFVTTHVIDWPDRHAIHFSGKEGLFFNWHAWVISNYILGLLILSLRFIPKMSELDMDALYAYIIFDIYGFYSYLNIGWPEPKSKIIIGYCLVVIIFIGLRIWKLLK